MSLHPARLSHRTSAPRPTALHTRVDVQSSFVSIALAMSHVSGAAASSVAERPAAGLAHERNSPRSSRTRSKLKQP